ncbi:hypothetical protein U9M48_011466 [Paspalum notatum var. saurae]|uniref:F-box domain-containing protein n=1 Tax=Paspalum notatum var. saurae TaxID=547442 RepID=A0AAQ3WHH8_PASNO
MDELMDDVVEGILLHLPPVDPASLVRTALVCRCWYRLISDRGFHRRFVELHRTPPTLGFFHNIRHWTRFLPAASSSFRPPYADADWRAMHVRNGRVLYTDGAHFVVSCPMTGDVRRLTLPRPPHTSEKYYNWSAAVLCAALGCDHLNCCPRGPFAVVAVVTNEPKLSTCACIYSSETGAWRVAACIEHPAGSALRVSPLLAAGNALYFEFILSARSSIVKILEYDLGKQELSFIDPPRNASTWSVLVADNGGRLGFVAVVWRSKLHIWSRDDDTATGQSGRGWARKRVIDLKGLLTSTSYLCRWHRRAIGLVTKVGEDVGYCVFLPYTSFYIPRNWMHVWPATHGCSTR